MTLTLAAVLAVWINAHWMVLSVSCWMCGISPSLGSCHAFNTLSWLKKISPILISAYMLNSDHMLCFLTFYNGLRDNLKWIVLMTLFLSHVKCKSCRKFYYIWCRKLCQASDGSLVKSGIMLDINITLNDSHKIFRGITVMRFCKFSCRSLCPICSLVNFHIYIHWKCAAWKHLDKCWFSDVRIWHVWQIRHAEHAMFHLVMNLSLLVKLVTVSAYHVALAAVDCSILWLVMKLQLMWASFASLFTHDCYLYADYKNHSVSLRERVKI